MSKREMQKIAKKFNKMADQGRYMEAMQFIMSKFVRDVVRQCKQKMIKDLKEYHS